MLVTGLHEICIVSGMTETRRRIERAVMEGLTTGTTGDRERYALPSSRLGAIRVALKASLQSENALPEVRRLLELIAALDGLDSPQAAESLRWVLRSDPDAVALLQSRIVPADRMEEMRRHASAQGRVQLAMRAVLMCGPGRAPISELQVEAPALPAEA